MKFTQLGILGVTGSGKSYLTVDIIEHLCYTESRFIIIDDLAQISSELDRRGISYVLCDSLESFIYNIVDSRSFYLLVQLKDDSEYYEVFSIIWRLNNLVLVIDELSLFCDPFTLPESLRHLTQRGRLKNISLIWNTQRPANISRNISSQNEFIISFKLYEVSDLKYFYFDREKIDKIRSLDLQKHQYFLVRGNEKLLKSKLNGFPLNPLY